jgi:hypothetical protein
VLSAGDVLRAAGRREDPTKPVEKFHFVTCPFQQSPPNGSGLDESTLLCALRPGACPVQRQIFNLAGEPALVCSEPKCVAVDWQLVHLNAVPTSEVRSFMTADVVAARPETSIGELARMMVDAHVHRVIVLDEHQKPIGVVSSTDLLAAVARQDERRRQRHPHLVLN